MGARPAPGFPGAPRCRSGWRPGAVRATHTEWFELDCEQTVEGPIASGTRLEIEEKAE